MRKQSYRVVSRYFVREQGWRVETIALEDVTFETAGAEASRVARVLDGIYGDDHFWTVNLLGPESDSSYFELFHGRTS
jgi:hypothetical protein